MKDYYRVLGVVDDAEDIIVRAAYKALAQRYHPDKWKGDPQEANRKMMDINEAYEALSDPVRRRRYDVQNIPQPIVARGATRFVLQSAMAAYKMAAL